MPRCVHFPLCSGCQLDLTGDSPPVWKEVLEKYKHVANPDIIAGPLTQWRCRAKLAVQDIQSTRGIGLYRAHTHQVIPIPHCLIHHPQINEAVSMVSEWINENPISIYNETTGQGELRYIQCVIERKTAKVQLSFVLNGAITNDPLLKNWADRLMNFLEITGKERWHSLWLNLNEGKTNTILSDHWCKLWGEELLWETLNQTDVCYHPGSFGQANLDLFEILLSRINAWVPHNSTVTELYAGVGAISLTLASKCDWIRCEEWSRFAEGCFQASSLRLPPSIAKRLHFTTGSAETQLHLLEGASTIIVDPPRKGLSLPVIQKINSSQSQQLIYVSCGWSSFQRDCAVLVQAGWTLKDLQGFSFFPGTHHIELLTRFER